MKDQLLQELDCCCCITITYGLCFYPLCKLTHSHQEVGLLVLGSFERPNHIKPPYRKRPSDGNHPEFLSWHMSLTCKSLASVTLAHNLFSICMSREPIKTMTESFSYQRSLADMMTTITRVNLIENIMSFVRRNTPLENTCDVSSV
jgi:hypothetical protein